MRSAAADVMIDAIAHSWRGCAAGRRRAPERDEPLPMLETPDTFDPLPLETRLAITGAAA
jgi:hypothetical protein